MMSFTSAYLCETGFSNYAATKESTETDWMQHQIWSAFQYEAKQESFEE
jgi:hypothetical protein